ncbi:solute carrier family 26 member 6 isoform X1 [Tropilaelaps mercedesae]|uniref:Solute carrier family 26 member 6 isoform X1 n=1 Tax=Tropilaelaps mercedesae TaxID=418985 RepID=A0A1V9Y2Q9_9ACAR|nr:solute carrier family 26 member 6 isoform X1 [Tropilaelaps mercedesae]
MGFLSLGSLSVLFSEPMLSGFTTGSAMHVIAAQLRGLFDIKISRRKGAFKAVSVRIITSATTIRFVSCR